MFWNTEISEGYIRGHLTSRNLWLAGSGRSLFSPAAKTTDTSHLTALTAVSTGPSEYVLITERLSHHTHHQKFTCILDFAFPIVPTDAERRRRHSYSTTQRPVTDRGVPVCERGAEPLRAVNTVFYERAQLVVLSSTCSSWGFYDFNCLFYFLICGQWKTARHKLTVHI